MVVIPGPVEFMMGSPPTEAGRHDDETQHKKRIGRTFALAAKAVTVEQYRKFRQGLPTASEVSSRTRNCRWWASSGIMAAAILQLVE